MKLGQLEGAVNSLTFFIVKGHSREVHSEELQEDINSGIVYLKSTVATSLLCLSRKFPLNRCTYVGEDNGANSLQVALKKRNATKCT